MGLETMVKRVLFLTPFRPGKFAGGHNYTRLLLQRLAEKDFHIDLLYYKYNSDPLYDNPDKSRIKVLKVCKISLLSKLFNALNIPFFHPIFTVRFSWLNLFFLKRITKKNHYDIIYLDHPQMYLYGYFFKQPKILMAHDVMAQRYERSSSNLVQKIVKAGEKFFMGMNDCTIFSFSSKDADLIRKYYGLDSKVTNFFIDDKIQDLPKPELKDYFVFFGKWDRDDNLDGLKWFFSDVYQKINNPVKIYIIGVALPEDFQNKLRNYPNVEYLGFVDNPYGIIANAKAMFAPLFSGAGVKVKVVESLACGTPVIGNKISFEGIDEDYREFMISATTPEDYVQAIENLDFCLERRILFREKFLKKYNSQSVVNYLEGISNV